MMWVLSSDVNGVVSESVCVCVYVMCVLACGFAALKVTGRNGTHSDTRLSSLSCLSAGVFLASCLLDMIPNFLTRVRATFTELSVTLYFPVPEFIMSMGFLFVLVMEQLILTVRDERERLDGQTERREEKESLLLRSPPHPDVSLSSVRSFVTLLSLCLLSFLHGLCADVMRLHPDVLLRASLVACSLVVLLAQTSVRRAAVSVCIAILSTAYPLGLVLRHTHRSLRLSRCTLEGLNIGSFVYIVFMDVMPRVTIANQQRIAKVTLILTGYSVYTAALLLKT